MENGNPEMDQTADDLRVCENVARLLEVSAGQIDMAMRDGDKSFQQLAQLTTEIFKIIGTLKDSVGSDNPELKALVNQLEDKSNAALSLFQFFDLMNQRVDHGIYSVSQLSQYLKDKNLEGADDCWVSFKDSITAQFSLEQEKELFELMMQGMPRHDAVAFLQIKRENSKPLSVEFF